MESKQPLRSTLSSKENAYEIKNHCEESSSDEFLNTSLTSIKNDHSYSCASGEDNSKKPPRLEEDWQSSSSTKSLEKQYCSKDNVEKSPRCTLSSKENANKEINICEDGSSDELLNTSLTSIKNDHSYACASGEGNSKKPPRLEEDRQSSSSAKSFEKQHSSKDNVEKSPRCTLSSKENDYKEINICEDGSSDELLNTTLNSFKNDQSYSCASGEDISKKLPKRLEENRQRSLSTKSLEKQHCSKKNFEKSPRCILSSKENAYKEINICEDGSSDELLNTNLNSFKNDQSYSCASGEDISKKPPKRLEEDRQRSSSTKSLEKHHSSEKGIKMTVRRTSVNKKKAYQVIKLSEGSFSNELLNTTSYSRASAEENRHKKEKKEKKLGKDRQWLPPVKSLEEHSLKSVEKTPLCTRSSVRNANKRLNYCEASSSDELENSNISKVQEDSLSSLKLLSGKTKPGKNNQRKPDLKKGSSDYSDFDLLAGPKVSTVDLNPGSSKKDADLSEYVAKNNNMLDAEKDSIFPETLSNETDLCKNVTPFRYWGKDASKPKETLRQSKGDEEHKKKDASAQVTPTPEKNYDTKKDWEKFKSLAALRK